MNFAYSTDILRQETGSFSRRHQIGPVIWPHFDLLWIHSGTVWLKIGRDKRRVLLKGPDGVLIFPDTGFFGEPIGAKAEASICHFVSEEFAGREIDQGFLRPEEQVAMHIQNLLRLSLHYARNNVASPVRERLLSTILDAFNLPGSESDPENRIQIAWNASAARLNGIRSLADVASLVGLSESAFRALHREVFEHSAGQHLRSLRLNEGERLLVTSGETVAEIAKRVGYSSSESFSFAFKVKHGRSPMAFRRWARNFA